MKSWVGMDFDTWAVDPWHCWVAIKRKLPGKRAGKELILWDPNWEAQAGSRPAGIGAQQALIQKCIEQKVNLKAVWIGGRGNTSKGECLYLSSEYIRHICEGGKKGNLPGVGKLEEVGFKRMLYSGSGKLWPWEAGKGLPTSPPPTYMRKKSKAKGKKGGKDRREKKEKARAARE